jgi:hypothetical protein
MDWGGPGTGWWGRGIGVCGDEKTLWEELKRLREEEEVVVAAFFDLGSERVGDGC